MASGFNNINFIIINSLIITKYNNKFIIKNQSVIIKLPRAEARRVGVGPGRLRAGRAVGDVMLDSEGGVVGGVGRVQVAPARIIMFYNKIIIVQL